MSGPYDYPMNISPLDQFDPNFPVYEQQYGAFQRLSGQPAPREGFAFWYRLDPHAQDSLYQRDPSVFARPMAMQPMTETQNIKHRRTRSGCFTCRSRRVKCDETRPICDRCRKGNRECEFPQSSSSAKKSKTTEPKVASSEASSDKVAKLDTIKDESEEEYFEEDDEELMPPPPKQTDRPMLERLRISSMSSSTRPQRPRQQSSTSITTLDKASPSTETTELDTPLSPAATRPPLSPSLRWKALRPSLRPEMEKYLRFQHDHMTHYHYSFRLDSEDFVHVELINLALSFEPLLYAVVAFAAYHHTVRLPDGESDFNAFWKYYCKSIVTLRKHLELRKERDDLVLLTVLQLATFEEYMGDWTNLTTHHKAAHGILTTRYTPETIMSSDRGRKILDWFSRLDVISGLMAVRDVSLDRSWLAYAHSWYQERLKTGEGNSLLFTIETFQKGTALIGRDIAHTFAHANAAIDQPGFSIDAVVDESQKLHTRLDELRRSIQGLNDPALAGVEEVAQKTEDGVFNTDVPLFRGELWPLNYVWLDWYGILILLRNQTSLVTRKAQLLDGDKDAMQDPQSLSAALAELTEYAKTQCEIFNAISLSSTAPPGAVLSCYAALGLSTVFLPRPPPETNSSYTMWARRQLANIEQQGYVWPPHFRKEMAKLWDNPGIEDWWLPNSEGKSRILGEIRAVVEDRLAAAAQGPDDGRNDLREIRGLFERMDVTGKNLRRSGSAATLDPSYVNSSAGIAHAASMVSTPEDGSSTGSASGFSPRNSGSDMGGKQPKRTGSRPGSNDSPLMSFPGVSGNRTIEIWEEHQQ